MGKGSYETWSESTPFIEKTIFLTIACRVSFVINQVSINGMGPLGHPLFSSLGLFISSCVNSTVSVKIQFGDRNHAIIRIGKI